VKRNAIFRYLSYTTTINTVMAAVG